MLKRRQLFATRIHTDVEFVAEPKFFDGQIVETDAFESSERHLLKFLALGSHFVEHTEHSRHCALLFPFGVKPRAVAEIFTRRFHQLLASALCHLLEPIATEVLRALSRFIDKARQELALRFALLGRQLFGIVAHLFEGKQIAVEQPECGESLLSVEGNEHLAHLWSTVIGGAVVCESGVLSLSPIDKVEFYWGLLGERLDEIVHKVATDGFVIALHIIALYDGNFYLWVGFAKREQRVCLVHGLLCLGEFVVGGMIF